MSEGEVRVRCVREGCGTLLATITRGEGAEFLVHYVRNVSHLAIDGIGDVAHSGEFDHGEVKRFPNNLSEYPDMFVCTRCEPPVPYRVARNEIASRLYESERSGKSIEFPIGALP